MLAARASAARSASRIARNARKFATVVDTAGVKVAAADNGEPTTAVTVLVKAGARVPVDGVVLTGVGAVDEASITGESIPAEKTDGDAMYAGTVATAGLLQVEARGVGADTTLARIIHRVEEAQDAKAPTQTFMEKFSRWYTPGIIVLAVVAGLAFRDVELALTLLDVLDYMEEIPVVAKYRLADGTLTDRFPMGKTLDDAQPVLETMPGWHCDITGVRKFEDLPAAAQNYVKRLEALVGCKIKYISVGPEREACIVRD